MRASLWLALLVGVLTWRDVSSRGGMGGGGRGSSGGRGGSSSSHSSSSSHASSSAGSHSSPSSSHASPGRGSAGGPYSSSYHPSPSISHSSFTSSLVTSLAISSLFHHSMSPYSHRYVYVVQEEKAPFRTNVTESRDYYFGVENVPIDNCTKALNETGDDTVDLIMAQSSPETNVSLCNICTYELNENSTDMPAVEFKDGRSPSQLAWICPSDEVCCGMECCTNEAQSDLKWWMIVLISVGTAAVVLILIKCCISLRKWCATSDCQTRELPHGPAPPLDKLPREMPASGPTAPAAVSVPPPPAARSYNLAAAENNNMRPASAASLSGIQPNLPKKQRRYEQQ